MQPTQHSNHGEPYLIGKFNGLDVIIDPYKQWTDTTISIQKENYVIETIVVEDKNNMLL